MRSKKSTRLTRKRRTHESPAVIAELGWRYHHLGIPYTTPRVGERYLDHLGVHVCGFETSPYGIEWMRFDAECQVPDIVRTVPHLAFVVDDLDQALESRQILIAPNSPSTGVRVAFILDDGAPVELLQFDRSQPPMPARTRVVQQRAASGRRRLFHQRQRSSWEVGQLEYIRTSASSKSGDGHLAVRSVTVDHLRVAANCKPAGPVTGGPGSAGAQAFFPPASSSVTGVVRVAFAGHREQSCEDPSPWSICGTHPLASGVVIDSPVFEFGYHLLGGTYPR
jgi:hypothetical protein